MYYEINGVLFHIENEQLYVNGKRIDIKNKTLKCVFFILKTDNLIFSKDELLAMVWDGAIVSDSSIFKQIQTVRKLFEKFNLPEDTIESIYGSGYKIKYPIVFHESKPESISNNKSHINLFHIVGITTLFFISVSLLYFYFDLEEEKTDKLSLENKNFLETEIRQDWFLGLKKINSLLESNREVYSNRDIGYLLLKKGQAELQLQNPQGAIKSITSALKLINEKDNEFVDSLISLSRAYSSNSQDQKSVETIGLAIKILRDLKPSQKLVDSLMTKSLLLRKLSRFEESLNANFESLELSKQIGDSVGELIAINNLAANYSQQGSHDKALEYSKIGLELSLKNGTSQHIANSYDSLAALYLENDQLAEAVEMIEPAIRYQVSNNSLRYLTSKLLNYYYILTYVNDYQYVYKFTELLEDYIQLSDASNKVKGKFEYLNAINLFMDGDTVSSADKLKKANELLIGSNWINFKIKTMTLDAVINYNNSNYLKSIQIAKSIMSSPNSTKRDKYLSALILTAIYSIQGDSDNYGKYLKIKSSLYNENWLFENALNKQLVEENHQEINIVELKKYISERVSSQNIKLDEEVLDIIENFIIEQKNSLNKK